MRHGRADFYDPLAADQHLAGRRHPPALDVEQSRGMEHGNPLRTILRLRGDEAQGTTQKCGGEQACVHGYWATV